jgi:ketosteroid isomerase-like protein
MSEIQMSELETFLSGWTTAERTGDSEKLDTLLTDDFYGVGPHGFVLPRAAWLGRHGEGLAYEDFSLEEIQVRPYGDFALVIARNNTRGTYRGQPLPEAVRATLAIASDNERLLLAAIHMSFIAGTQGSPPLATTTDSPASRANVDADGQGR